MNHIDTNRPPRDDNLFLVVDAGAKTWSDPTKKRCEHTKRKCEHMRQCWML